MATKRAIEPGPLGVAPRDVTWWLRVRALERAAIAVGIERERGRQTKRKGPRR